MCSIPYCYFLRSQPYLLFELSFLSTLHLSSSSSTLLSRLVSQSVNVIMLLSPLKPSSDAAFPSGKGYFLSLAYKFSHDQANADFCYNIILSLALLNHWHIPEPDIRFRFQHLGLSSNYFLCTRVLCFPLSSPPTLSRHQSISDTLKAQLSLTHFLRSFHS